MIHEARHPRCTFGAVLGEIYVSSYAESLSNRFRLGSLKQSLNVVLWNQYPFADTNRGDVASADCNVDGVAAHAKLRCSFSNAERCSLCDCHLNKLLIYL